MESVKQLMALPQTAKFFKLIMKSCFRSILRREKTNVRLKVE